MAGVDAAFYLVHSMRGGRGFHERDLRAAAAFAAAARRSRVGRLVYLGGLGDPASDLSEHLRSRQETGDALRTAGVPVCELRAAIVVGSGSLSFEMIRYLTERLPVDDLPEVGVQSRAADRGRRRARLPHRGARTRDAGRRRRRDRRHRRRDLRRDDARLRAGARPAPPADPGAGAHAAPVVALGLLGDADAALDGAAADRGRAQRGRGA